MRTGSSERSICCESLDLADQFLKLFRRVSALARGNGPVDRQNGGLNVVPPALCGVGRSLRRLFSGTLKPFMNSVFDQSGLWPGLK